MFFGGAWIVGGWEVVGWGRESYLWPSTIASFSSWDFGRSSKHDTFLHVSTDISTGILWTIAVSDFHPLEIYKNLGLPLSTITFTVNCHKDNQFYKHIHLRSFFIKINVKVLTKVFYTHIWFQCETLLLLFFNKNHRIQKKSCL